MTYRWLFGDRLGPRFLDDTDAEVLMIESTAVLGRRPFHRQKAHLLLSAMRHRVAELGARCTYRRSEPIVRPWPRREPVLGQPSMLDMSG